MLMVGDLGEEGHHFNGLLARWMRIPPFAGQSLPLGIGATQQGHRQHEMHMKASQSSFGVSGFLVQHKQGIELLGLKARCHHSLELVQDVQQLGLGGFLIGSKCQATTGIFVLAGNAVDDGHSRLW